MQTGSGEPVYVISVAARLAGLPCWVLRVLDQEGIVVPVRTESNRRLYSDRDIAILAHVRHLTEGRGVNIAGVKVILEMERTSAQGPFADGTDATPHPATSNGNGEAAGLSRPPAALPPYQPSSHRSDL